MNVYIKKALNSVFWVMDKVAKKQYVKLYPQYLRWLGIKISPQNFSGGGTWISPTVFFDSAGYDQIEIGESVTISFDVTILVHDYSIIHAARATHNEGQVKKSLVKPVLIGNNVYIGAGAIILPGTEIGNNVIIGAGAVVKGKLEPNSVYAGNPARKIKTVEDFYKKNTNIEGA